MVLPYLIIVILLMSHLPNIIDTIMHIIVDPLVFSVLPVNQLLWVFLNQETGSRSTGI